MTILGIPVTLLVRAALTAINYLFGKMREADVRELVNNENYVRERNTLDRWLRESDRIYAESLAKTDEQLDQSLDEDLST